MGGGQRVGGRERERREGRKEKEREGRGERERERDVRERTECVRV